MGGICAVVHLGGGHMSPGKIDSMMAAAAHRGPDGVAGWSQHDAALGQLTLLASQGRHPSAAPVVDGQLVIVADARIDNRKELLASLPTVRADGGADATDARLILEAYRRWGVAAPAHLVGDFVFVIWDADIRTLLAARDPSGSRPLYVHRHDGRLFLASEIKQILEVAPGPHRINERMLGAYLSTAPGRPDWTFYERIDQVPPAHLVRASPQRYEVRRFWDIDPATRISYDTEEEYANHLRHVFAEAVEVRMDAARPMGVWLSGGLDSGSIGAMIGLHIENGAPGSLHAFSYAFDELREGDERHVSRHIVDRYQLGSTDIPADTAWPLRQAPLHGPDRDEPLMGAYQVLHDRVYAAARDRGIGAMFTGSSGDNIAGGDVFDYPGELRRHPERAWRHLRQHAAAVDQRLAYAVVRRLVWPAAIAVMPRAATQWLRRAVLRRDDSLVPPWIRREFAERIDLDEIVRWVAPAPAFRRRAAELRYRTVTDLITARAAVWNERNHARNHMAYLDPWSDRRLAEFAVAVPQWLFNRGRERKELVRIAMRGVIPEEARRLAGKIYPDALYRRGIQEREAERVRVLLRSSRLAGMGIIDADALAAGIPSQTQEATEWPVLSTELWVRRYWE